MKVVSVVGARPQFIKAAVVSAALASEGIEEILVHTGQHYDFEMSSLFFEQLGLPEPMYNLGVGSGSHAIQTGRILERVEEVLVKEQPELLLVFGDTNSTLAAALAASKICLPVAHVEAGLRSYNRRMPEEINRVLTDHISTLLFCPTGKAVAWLRREGIEDGVSLVGDVMYDAFLTHEPLYQREMEQLLRSQDLNPRGYFIATIHRAENTNDVEEFESIVNALNRVADSIAPVLWPMHPRTRARLREEGVSLSRNIRVLDPVGYIQMQAYLAGARGVLTDSGGLQKEAAFHRVPTVTLRKETEWPETIEQGCNILAGTDPLLIVAAAAECSGRANACNAFGNGDAALLIAKTITRWSGSGNPSRQAPKRLDSFLGLAAQHLGEPSRASREAITFGSRRV